MFAWLMLFCAISATQCSVKGGGQSRQQWPAYCPGFPTEKYVLHRDFRDSLARNVLAARNKSMKYDCVLEALASARMLSSQYYERRTQNMDIIPLEYQEVADLIVFENFAQAAAKEWAPWFRAVNSAKEKPLRRTNRFANLCKKYDCVLEALASARMLSPQYYERKTRNMDIIPLEYHCVIYRHSAATMRSSP
ncbi:hypothetical protein OESDEN_06166 [Oesophagostomum dentatum]|uniref:SCP-like protein n=1 Tax=Oesophagostomum dentatum TaxID=61180 RepID=A0A0B1TCR4_OESDE|nr:hypothetical protein OESDEN_06166 [Oesophagostomum dentatum]